MNLSIGDKVIRATSSRDYYAKELSINTEYEVERIEEYVGVYYIKLKYYLYPVNAINLIKVNV